MFRKLAVCVAVTVALVAGSTVSADAATSHRENDLRTWCNSHHHVSCVADADDDTGRLVVRDRHGKAHRLTGAHVLAYLRGHAPACREEDSPRCWWDASEGNGMGQSFFVVGGKHEGQGDVFYISDFS
jgi:hypothetical protein